jgi:hypothetical protein
MEKWPDFNLKMFFPCSVACVGFITTGQQNAEYQAVMFTAVVITGGKQKYF